MKDIKSAAVGAAIALGVGMTPSAFASEKVAEFAGTGFIFKDSIEVTAIEDPKVMNKSSCSIIVPLVISHLQLLIMSRRLLA